MSPVRASLVYSESTADTTPPGAVTDLFYVASNGHDDVVLATNAMPGGNGFSGARPMHFEFRRAATPIVTEQDWTDAGELFGNEGVQIETGLVGQYREYYLVSLTAGTFYYHVRWTDLAGNVGDISNGVQVTLT